jgi:hypothetical protein
MSASARPEIGAPARDALLVLLRIEALPRNRASHVQRIDKIRRVCCAGVTSPATRETYRRSTTRSPRWPGERVNAVLGVARRALSATRKLQCLVMPPFVTLIFGLNRSDEAPP